MAKNTIQALTAEERMEADYQKALRRAKGAGRMEQVEDKIRMYKQAIRMFRELEGYKDSKEQIEECKKQLPIVRRQRREEVYQTGMALKEQARTSADYEAAIQEFSKLKNPYMDIPQQIEECRRLSARADQREKRKRACGKVFVLTALVAAVVFVFYLTTKDAFYREGKLLMSMGDYERAETIFSNCEDYRDTKELLVECNYQRAMRFWQEGDLERSLRLLKARVGRYKDAPQLKAQIEQQILEQAGVGDSVIFGDTRWIVTEVLDRQRMLVKQVPSYYELPYRTDEWETSAIRKWLNRDYFGNRFSKLERGMIKDSDGDNIFLLSIEEAQSYQELLAQDENARSWWLRTAGTVEGSVAYVTADGLIMKNGADVEEMRLAIRPALWVDVTN